MAAGYAGMLLLSGMALAQEPSLDEQLCATLNAETVVLGEVQQLLSEGARAQTTCTVEISRKVAIDYGPSAGQRISQSLRRGKKRGKGVVALMLLPMMPLVAIGDALSRAGRPSHREELVQVEVPALTLALAHQDHLLVHSLLVAGAEVAQLDLAPEQILHAAEQPELFELLCRYELEVDRRGEGQSAALSLAVPKRPELVPALLACGADPELADRKRKLPLDQALEVGDTELTLLLIEHGANIEREDRAGRSALLRAVIRGSEEQVAFLLEQGADLEHLDKKETSALWQACWYGELGIAEILLDAGAPFDARTVGWVDYGANKQLEGWEAPENWRPMTLLLLGRGLPVGDELRRMVVELDDLELAEATFAQDSDGSGWDYRKLTWRAMRLELSEEMVERVREERKAR